MSSCDWDYVCLNNQEAESLDLALELLFRTLNRPPGRPLIYWGRRPAALQSPDRLIDCIRLGLLIFLALQYKLHDQGSLTLRALGHLWAVGPLLSRRLQA